MISGIKPLHKITPNRLTFILCLTLPSFTPAAGKFGLVVFSHVLDVYHLISTLHSSPAITSSKFSPNFLALQQWIKRLTRLIGLTVCVYRVLTLFHRVLSSACYRPQRGNEIQFSLKLYAVK